MYDGMTHWTQFQKLGLPKCKLIFYCSSCYYRFAGVALRTCFWLHGFRCYGSSMEKRSLVIFDRFLIGCCSCYEQLRVVPLLLPYLLQDAGFARLEEQKEDCGFCILY